MVRARARARTLIVWGSWGWNGVWIVISCLVRFSFAWMMMMIFGDLCCMRVLYKRRNVLQEIYKRAIHRSTALVNWNKCLNANVQETFGHTVPRSRLCSCAIGQERDNRLSAKREDNTKARQI